MVFINLDPHGISPFPPKKDASVYDGLETSVFPGGEVHVRFYDSEVLKREDIRVNVRLRNSEDVMRLLLVTAALREHDVKEITLYMPYVPYARQDHQIVEGDIITINTFAELINAQGYKHVHVYDPHSYVTPALLKRCIVHDNFLFIERIVKELTPQTVLVAPDEGAAKKIISLSTRLGLEPPPLLCQKTREKYTGKVNGTTFHDYVGKYCTALIVDDICDGGASFKLLPWLLRERCEFEKIILAVSHGIFSKGFEPLKDFDHIYSTDSFKIIENTDNFTQIPLSSVWQ